MSGSQPVKTVVVSTNIAYLQAGGRTVILGTKDLKAIESMDVEHFFGAVGGQPLISFLYLDYAYPSSVKFMSQKKKSLVTLSPFGRNKQETPNLFKSLAADVPPATPAGTPPFDWKNAAIDGGIIAALTFFTTLGGVTLANGNLTTTLISATISAAAQFFVMLAVKRGLRK